MSMSAGLVVYRGPSRLDGAPIVAVVTLASHNRKIGDMAQAWVMRADVTPRLALARGLDRSICGDCVHRSDTDGITGRSCYVRTQLGPTTIWDAYQGGAYEGLTDGEGAGVQLAGAQLRICAYGDPAAVPFEIWRSLLAHVSSFTAYSHQWRTCDQRFRLFTMASVESEGEAEYAHRLGWRTFRTRLASEPVRADELVCPASDEAGHRVQCDACGLCVGRRRDQARSIAIIAHGRTARFFRDRKAALSV